MREIITLQLGQRSNYVATHFWNTQESYFTYSESEESPIDHDVHFRAGVGADGTETFTPRTVIYDLKGGFGNLRQYNALYELEEEEQSGIPKSLWSGNEVVQKQPAIPQNEYQKSLDLGLPPPRLTSESVRYWSDFNRVFYHPKSIVQLNEYDLGSQLMPFEDWPVGQALFNDLDKENDILDRDLRPFAEECDQLKAIQIFSGVDDAWGGFATSYIDRLKDEYGNKNIWVWGLESEPKAQRQKQMLASANAARSLGEISPEVSAYIPISYSPRNPPDYITAGLHPDWYSSALISLAAESVTLPTRLRRHGGLDIWSNGSPRNIYRLQSKIGKDISAPAPESSRNTLLKEDEDENEEENRDLVKGFDIDLSPISSATTKKPCVFSQISVIRDSISDSATNGQLAATGHTQSSRNSPVNAQRFHSTLEAPILDSFPHDLIHDQGPPGTTLGVRSALSTSTQVGEYLKQLRRSVGRFVPLEEREELLDGLTTVAEGYQDRWESDSESDDY